MEIKCVEEKTKNEKMQIEKLGRELNKHLESFFNGIKSHSDANVVIIQVTEFGSSIMVGEIEKQETQAKNSGIAEA